MLVIKLKKGDGANIGDSVRIRVLQTAKGYCRIGIDAPLPEFLVTRVYQTTEDEERKQREEEGR
jgi:sRNA-binding carbon storage regulator CsrA